VGKSVNAALQIISVYCVPKKSVTVCRNHRKIKDVDRLIGTQCIITKIKPILFYYSMKRILKNPQG